MKAFLILEDGTVFEGTSIGSTREVISEIVLRRTGRRYDLPADRQLWYLL